MSLPQKIAEKMTVFKQVLQRFVHPVFVEKTGCLSNLRFCWSALGPFYKQHIHFLKFYDPFIVDVIPLLESPKQHECPFSIPLSAVFEVTAQV